ncbi:hypothetical protein FACS189418_7010 [Clostridia bacterium]|nr:hypothetical protein FACS189418_7010 [Clostridia bacterium]
MSNINKCIFPTYAPIIPPPIYCDYWLVKRDTLPPVSEADRNHAYILPDDTIWVLDYDGNSLIQIGTGSGQAITIDTLTPEFLEVVGNNPIHINFVAEAGEGIEFDTTVSVAKIRAKVSLAAVIIKMGKVFFSRP